MTPRLLSPRRGIRKVGTLLSTRLHGGVDVVSVAAWMGDSPQTVLNYYAHLMPDADARGRKVIDEAFAESVDGPDAAQAEGDQA